ncbi:MAG: methylmalonyl-CoA mutase family protein [Saprospiraceae bacterium]
MADQENLFADFSASSKEDWLTKVAAELKGKALTSLDWSLNELDLQPFFQRTDLDGKDQQIALRQSNNNWKIGEDIIVSDPKNTNKILLDALANGVDAPTLRIGEKSTQEDLGELLAEIRLDFIEAFYHCSNGEAAVQFGQLLTHHLTQQKIMPATLRGGIFATTTIQNGAQLKQLHTQFPNFQLLRIQITATGNLVADLAQGMWQASKLLRQWTALGWSADKINQILQFSVEVEKNYFAEIAKIRALKLLWANVLKAFGAAQIEHIYIEARLAAQSQSENENQNMISATTQSMSAALAGVNCLNVLPADHFSGTERPFTKRIARNVQHLLKMESYLDQVLDPAAGSYYVEHLTQALFEGAWKQFVALDEKG